jgi:hypothetical protein
MESLKRPIAAGLPVIPAQRARICECRRIDHG